MSKSEDSGLLIGGRTPLRRLLTVYSFVLPALLPMALVVGLPLVQTILFSFTNLREKNFELLTIGIVANAEKGTCSGAVNVGIDPSGPAARAGITSGACVRSLSGERTATAPALRRLADKSLRAFRNGDRSPVRVEYANPGSKEFTSASLTIQRQPFDWSNNPDRDSTSWGVVGSLNYRQILGSRTFWTILGVTLLWTVVNVALHYSFGLFLALMLHRGVRGTALYRMLLMLPWAVPVYVSAFSWRWLFNGQYGLFNVLLTKVGASPLPFLSDSTWTFIAATITNVWLGVPFMMVMLLAGLQAIPGELSEAAAIDGCSRRQIVWHIIMPMLRPVSMTVLLLGAIWTFNMFNVIFLLQGGGNNVEILATKAFRMFSDEREYAVAAAYGVVILAILMVFAAAYARLLSKSSEGLYG